jgi:hypothetical protein
MHEHNLVTYSVVVGCVGVELLARRWESAVEIRESIVRALESILVCTACNDKLIRKCMPLSSCRSIAYSLKSLERGQDFFTNCLAAGGRGKPTMP